jgi:hypothetical protein
VAIPTRNRRATGTTIKALKSTGRLEHCDEALMGLARCSADALDQALAYESKAYAIAAVGRWHLMVLQALLGRPEEQGDSAYAEVIAALSGPLGYAPGGMGDADGDPPYWRTHGTHPERDDGG